MRSLIISTLFIVCFQWASATDFYVSTSGNDASGNGSQASPWRTLQYACTKVAANQGHTIRISAGTFIENRISVPTGVSIIGAGIGQTILKANSSFYYNPASPGYGTDKFLVNLSSSSLTNGNQSIKGFTIDGDGKKLHGGIYVKYRTNILIEAVRVQFVNFTGLWLWDVKDSRVTGIQVKDCSWGSSSWAAGAISLANLERVEIDHINIDEGFGYGIKALGSNGPMHYVKMHDNHISVTPHGQWKTPSGGSAPNIAVEFWNVDILGCEFYNNYMDNVISLVMDYPQWTTPRGIQTMRLYNNTMDMDARSKGNGYAFEISIHDVEIDHNFVNKGRYAISNFDSHGTKMSNWSIHHNVFYGISSYYPPEIVRSQKSGLHNVKFYNNTIETIGTNTVNIIATYGGTSNKVEIKNNLIINSNTAYSWYPNKLVYLENSTMTNLVVSNNLLYNLPLGSVPGTYTNNLSVDPKINKTGARPTPYYLPLAGSPLIDAGINVGLPFTGSAPDIGAYESTGSVISVTGVSISQPTLTLPVNGTSQLAKTISPSNATNQNVTWSSSNTAIATVSNAGLVTAIAAGSATITVTTADGGKKSTSAITVTAPVPVAVTGVSISQPNVTLALNGSSQLTKSISPATATNQNVTWKSSNNSVATVNSTGLVTAVSPGNTTITVTTVDGSKSATASVTVGSSQVATVDLDNASHGSGKNQFNFSGSGWVHGTNTSDPFFQKTVSYSNTASNYTTLTFTGHKIELYSAKASHHGIIAVSVDNGPETYVDLYSATRQNYVNVYNSILLEGDHTIKIRVTGTKNTSSSGTYAIIDYIKVYSNSATVAVPVSGVTVSPLTVSIGTGNSYTLTASVSPANASNKNVAWSSSNTSVATVSSNGVVTTKAQGSATITATTADGQKTSSSIFTVAVPVAGVSVTPATVLMNIGSNHQLSAAVSPATASNKNINWVSSNVNIATVGPNGLVTAIASGNATITATTIDGGKKSSSVVTVKAPVTGVSVTPTATSLEIAATQQVTATVSPVNATDKSIIWSSSNTGIATVNINGLVTAVAPGVVTITATTVDGNKTASSSLTVNSQQNFIDLDDATKGSNINQFRYTGSTWTYATNTGDEYFNKTCSYSNAANNYATLTFSGSKVEFYSSKASHHGIAAVSIDNGPETLVDLYATTRQSFSMIFSSGILSEGTHTIKIRVTGTKNSASSGTYTIIDYLKVYSTSALEAPTQVTNMLDESVLTAAQTEAELTGQVQIFPNPIKSGEILHIVLPAATGEVRIIDVTGFAHYTSAVTSTEIEIPIGSMPKGMYFLQWRSTNGEVLEKLLVD